MQLDGLPRRRAGHDHDLDRRQDRRAWMPIFIFFAQGFEHSVVNMFIIPTGMMMGAKVTRRRMVAVESDSGDARQSGRRLRLHRASRST